MADRLTEADSPSPAPYEEPSADEFARPAEPVRGRSAGVTRILAAAIAVTLAVAVTAALLPGPMLPGPAPQAPAGAAPADSDQVRILDGEPATLDPAAAGDATSAGIIQQVFETLTAIDPSLTVRPALAERWELEQEGRRVIFHLRPDLAFSDGTPLRAGDVVRSWLRVIDPEAPSPLATLILDVAGAAAYAAGQASADEVAIRADGDQRVVVDLVRPAGDFPSIVASPTFAIVPPGIDEPDALDPDGFVASGGYVLSAAQPGSYTFTANERYWAGPPPIETVELITDTGGRSGTQLFEAGEADYTSIGDFDATWIRFDPDLGPRLRSVPALSVEYLGFDTAEPPFDDPRVRRAFVMAVDWNRLVELAGTSTVIPASSMVPPGIPGRSDEDFLLDPDPEAARALLADAGYPGGDGFPTVTFLTSGSTVDAGMIADLERELGVEVEYEGMDFGTYSTRLTDDPPDIWSLSWIADYPGRNDFLGVLLGGGASNNYGRWSNADFDAAIADANATMDDAQRDAAFDRAEAIVRDEAPVIPLAYAAGWALARDGLLGATQNGLGALRWAGLAWQE